MFLYIYLGTFYITYMSFIQVPSVVHLYHSILRRPIYYWMTWIKHKIKIFDMILIKITFSVLLALLQFCTGRILVLVCDAELSFKSRV
jgi:hypothetical protein